MILLIGYGIYWLLYEVMVFYLCFFFLLWEDVGSFKGVCNWSDSNICGNDKWEGIFKLLYLCFSKYYVSVSVVGGFFVFFIMSMFKFIFGMCLFIYLVWVCGFGKFFICFVGFLCFVVMVYLYWIECGVLIKLIWCEE